MEVIIAPKAQRDIVNILAWTQENFGPQTLKRYARLIETAIEEIAADPNCAGSVRRPEIAEDCRTYHLFHSRKRAGTRGNRVRKPRHLLLYRVAGAGVVEIGRVLHDSVDLEQHLPEEYRG
ncbi:MAG TPA: type II toxin-antitoxin system RelE/ParE family toxin [Gemmataceae bacterium]|jgi:toxin ParE1/3/4|nr:type II toxin-antitoxin system RelE/ParE family toxin [Gemmataceae bacterium]